MSSESTYDSPALPLFPLAVTAFEEFMLRDDRASLPMSFFIEIGLTGALNRPQLELAFHRALQRHPMLSARIRSGWLHDVWVEGTADARISWLNTSDQLPGPSDRWIDLKKNGGLRCWIISADQSHRVIFQFHHASTDGIGALRFIGDLLALYGLATATGDQEHPVLEPIDHHLLPRRGDYWQSGRPSNFWPRLWFRLREVLGQFPCPLARPRGAKKSADPETQTASPSQRLFITRVLENRELRRLNKAASDRAITPNDILTWAMFQTLQHWNELHGAAKPGTVYRIILPTSVRTPDYDNCSASNILAYSVMTKCGREISDSKLLSVIAQESAVSVSGQEAGMVLMCLNAGRRVPGLLAGFTALPLCLSTAVLANVGDVRRQLCNQFPLKQGKIVAGTVTMEYLLGVAPIRPKTNLAISLGKYAGKLFINLNLNPESYSDAEAEVLADLFVEQIRKIQPAQDDEPTA
ncbi:MAG: hypothetical protein JNM43_02715 [Planctomycetaceae bacterium]|nr:hypothetical protein [Planctomycetaceae bacterium]